MNTAKIKISEKIWCTLEPLLLAGYPKNESATFLNCGWEQGYDSLIVTVNDLLPPKCEDAEFGVSSISLKEEYSLRCALSMERQHFAVGLVHSHPLDYATYPSKIDDEMDNYYADYFTSFLPSRPYISFIISKTTDGEIRFSGRVFINGEWILCSQLQIVGLKNQIIYADNVKAKDLPNNIKDQLDRIIGAMGIDSATKLWRSKVGIIGAGGTGSAVFHSLARSCVGTIVVIDPDFLTPSNVERVHGVKYGDLATEFMYKIEVMKRFAAEINPSLQIIALPCDARDEVAKKYLIECDFLFGCTDSQVGKILTSELALKYIIPAIHVNVAMEVTDSKIKGEIIHLTQYGPGLPCVYCHGFVNAQRLAQELMTPEERVQRQIDESKQIAPTGTYWVDEPVLHTVGSLTTIAAELATNYSIGLITEAYTPPSTFLEMNLLKPSQSNALKVKPRKRCMCESHTGVGGQKKGWLVA